MSSAAEARTPHGDPVIRYDYGPGLLPEPTAGALDMWRYRALLPLEAGPVRYPLAVGGTPLLAPPDLRTRVGVADLWLKDETTGPSASNKDRATALVLETGLRSGATVVTTSSTGNAAISTAIGAAAAGVRAVIFVPGNCQPAKVAAMRGAGACVFRVAAGYRAAFELSREAAHRFGWLDRNTGVNPVTVEGKKTVAFEIWEQLGRRAPGTVVVPVGDGTTLVGMAKGFRELRACGAIAEVPRLVGVQALGCQPLVLAWRGLPGTRPDPTGTLADGIAVPRPAIGDWAVDEVRHSNGAFVAVPDTDLRAAVESLSRHAGVRSELAGAAALAGTQRAIRDGLTRSTEVTVVLVTGGGLHSPPAGTECGPEFSIEGRLGEVEGAVSAWLR